MRVYCKCLNIELEFDTLETRPKPFEELEGKEDCPPKCDHELFTYDLHIVPIQSLKDLIVTQDDVVKRKARSEHGKKPGSLEIHAYLPELVLTHKRSSWMIRECFLCHTLVMAYFFNGTIILCPSVLLGMSPDDDLQSVQTSSDSLCMLSRSAIANIDKVADEFRSSSHVKKQLESMSYVWHIAHKCARDEMERRIDEMRRQQEAAYEELMRLSSELQGHVANSYVNLLTLKNDNPTAYISEEKTNESEMADALEKMTERYFLEGHPAGDMPDIDLTQLHLGEKSQSEVEVAKDALDFTEADVFDDFREPFEQSDTEEVAVGRVSNENEVDETGDKDDGAFLSTSAISSSMKAGRGMRAALRCVDDRLPDTEVFNAMTDAERTYAIERASYQRQQDNRLNELYGDVEPPYLQDLRRRAEQTRQNLPVEPVCESSSAEQSPAAGDKPSSSHTSRS